MKTKTQKVMAYNIEDEVCNIPCKMEVDNLEHPYCFVCDHPASGVFFNLLNCVTEHSRTKVSLKLGDLVGKEFLVVIESSDVICGSCIAIFNTMDRLESQLTNLGNTILNYLEEKYTLTPGEIFETAPPLQIVFKKDLPKTKANKKNQNSDTREKEKSVAKVLSCDQCSYTTTFKALMVFHMRQHNKLNNPPPSSEQSEQVVNAETEETEDSPPQPSRKPARGGKRLKTGRGGSKKMKMTPKEVVAPSPPLSIQGEGSSIHVDGMDPGGGFEFIPGQDDDHLSEEMLIKVESLVQSAGVEGEIDTGTFQVDMGETDDLPVDNGLQVFLTDHDLLEVDGEPGVFCMIDSETGKIIQRLKKVDDGSFVPIEVLENECQTVMHQLEDGSFALVSLPNVLEDSPDGLTLM